VILITFLFVVLLSITAEVEPTVNTTLSGRRCQRWDSQSPHYHPYLHLSAFDNYCQNPNEDAGPWCYTTDRDLRTEFCRLPIYDSELLFYLLFCL